SPDHPARSPNSPGHPAPAETRQQRPATIVITCPTKRLIAHPQPAAVVGVGPVPNRVGAPVVADIVRLPSRSVVVSVYPLAIFGKVIVKIVGVFGDVVFSGRACGGRRRGGGGFGFFGNRGNDIAGAEVCRLLRLGFTGAAITACGKG